MATKTCPVCKGLGIVDVWPVNLVTVEATDCPECNGKGTVNDD